METLKTVGIVSLDFGVQFSFTAYNFDYLHIKSYLYIYIYTCVCVLQFMYVHVEMQVQYAFVFFELNYHEQIYIVYKQCVFK